MNISIIGNGSFGTFLSELLGETPWSRFKIVEPEQCQIVVLAVPISAYDELGGRYKDKLIINVCSVQLPSREILLRHTSNLTCIHPLFGRRTPTDKRFSIITDRCGSILEEEFLKEFSFITTGKSVESIVRMSPEDHDMIMFKTHYRAVESAKLLKPIVDNAKDIPDEFIPNSFRLLRQFVQTMEDMPAGTLESIDANPFKSKT